MINIREFIPTISEQFKNNCDKPISNCELVEALKHTKTDISPDIYGLFTELNLFFWDIIEALLIEMYKECIANKEMTTTMKQGFVSMILKPNKDSLFLENWRPITLLNVDYKLLALVYAIR